jgi:DNA polymerase I-like protein with 3'-5' exonuclease and polymerase domains
MPVLLRNARRGMRIDVAALERDTPVMKRGIEVVDGWLAKRLKRPGMNMDSDRQLAAALYDAGVVKEFKRTPKGQLSISKANLTIDMFNDRRVYQALTYRAQMTTCVNMFMEPWLELAGDGDVIHPNWAQVRSPKGADTQGARSGRIICNRPNLLNLPRKWKRSISAGYAHPSWLKIPELPFIRTYALPSKNKRWGKRDWNQQEVRLFGHFEEGPVAQGFMQNPRFDMHEGVRKAEEDALIGAGLRTEFGRDDAKGTVFGAFYGQGLTGLMISLKLRDPEDREVGKIIHRALHSAAPSIKELSSQLTALSKEGRPIRTIGGRLYYCEPSTYSEKFGRNMTYEYKLISFLIQGSGADCVKEAICRYEEHPKRTERMLVTVYDEIDLDLPLSQNGAKHEMGVLRECMEGIECDVPLLSDGEVGPSWGDLKPWKD